MIIENPVSRMMYHYGLNRAINGKKGQKILKDFLTKLETMEEKKLSPFQGTNDLYEMLGTDKIVWSLRTEIMRINDIYATGCLVETKEARWKRMHEWVKEHINEQP